MSSFSIEYVGEMIGGEPTPIFYVEFLTYLFTILIGYGFLFGLVALLTFRRKVMDTYSRARTIWIVVVPIIVLSTVGSGSIIRFGQFSEGDFLGNLNYYPNGIINNLLLVYLPTIALSLLMAFLLGRSGDGRWKHALRTSIELSIWSILFYLFASTTLLLLDS